MTKLAQYPLQISAQFLGRLGFEYECGVGITADNVQADKAAFNFDGHGLGNKVGIHAPCLSAWLPDTTNVKLNQVSLNAGVTS